MTDKQSIVRGSAIRVALDLETTGLHAEQDAILEVAAIKFQGSTIVDTFETFVTPGRSIPYRVQRLTGIKPEQLVGAPHFASIANRLQTFLGNYPIVGHSIPFDVGFLRRQGLARTNPLIDTFELATVLLPSLVRYDLGQVAEALDIEVPQDRHRAMVDTVLAMQVFLALHQRLQAVDLSLLKDLASLDAPHTWPLLHFFRQELRERRSFDGVQGALGRGSLGDRLAAQLGMDPRVLSFAIANQPSAVASAPTHPGNQGTTVVVGGDASTVEQEYREARSAVYEALEQQKDLLIEITIGGSNYTPVLLPALEWLAKPVPEGEHSARRLLIACANQQQARRLTETILPQLQSLLDTQMPVAYLAERNGYLCTHRWFGAALRRTSGELTAEQARGLAKIGLWAQQTLTGERSELTLLPQELSAWERIASGVERVASSDTQAGNSYQRCTYRRKGYCFVGLAEERVKAARIVITTHAGLYDDLSSAHSLLADIPQRLILEADLLEEESARWSSTELDQTRLYSLLDTIGLELPDGRYQGLLALAAPSLRSNGPGGLSTQPTVAKTELDARILGWFQVLRQARAAIQELFASFRLLLEASLLEDAHGNGRGKGKDGHGNRGGRSHERLDQPLRLTDQIRNLSVWKDTERAWQQAEQRLQAVIDLTHEAEQIILTTERSRHRLEIGSGEDASVASELAASSQQLQSVMQMGQQALSMEDNERVYWLRMPPLSPSAQQTAKTPRTHDASPMRDGSPVLHAQLIQTSLLIRRLCVQDSLCTIFAGAALSVDGSFSFTRSRLGLENEPCTMLSVTKDRYEQTLLYIPDDVPEPNAPQYQRQLDSALMQLAMQLEGQLVVLYTSYAALRSSYAAIKPFLESKGVLVLGQGVDGSPRQLWQVFHKQERVVLLGAGNFWEGLEEAVCSPACLVITRLPMPVLNDPPIAARAEHYSDLLHHLTVPIAALRIRRALNRLIWNGTKRNAVVLFDRRVISKEYGATVLHSLPACAQRHAAVSHMPETILDWLTGTDIWD